MQRVAFTSLERDPRSLELQNPTFNLVDKTHRLRYYYTRISVIVGRHRYFTHTHGYRKSVRHAGEQNDPVHSAILIVEVSTKILLDPSLHSSTHP